MERHRLTDRARAALVPTEVLLRLVAVYLAGRAAFVGVLWVVVPGLGVSIQGGWVLLLPAVCDAGFAVILARFAVRWTRWTLALCRPAEVRAREAAWVAAGVAVTAILLALDGAREIVFGLSARFTGGGSASMSGRPALGLGLDGDPRWMIAPAVRLQLAVLLLLTLPWLVRLWARWNRRR